MSIEWRARQTATRALVSSATDHVLSRRGVTADALFGLCQLTWITQSHLGERAGYIRNTKLPGLVRVYGSDVPSKDLDAAASVVAAMLGSRAAAATVRHHTGITNLRNAYRGTAKIWIEQNRLKVVDILRRARTLNTDAEAVSLAKRIEKLPPIPLRMADNHMPTSAANLLTPLVFCLDPRYRFPVINGNKGIQKLLKSEGVTGATLDRQYTAMVQLIGKNGIADAGELDLLGQVLPQVRAGLTTMLKTKPETGTGLKVKDEDDIEVVRQGGTKQRMALHNQMTNVFKEQFEGQWKLTEGESEVKYDIQVCAFKHQKHLLIEAKSSAEEADVRMAIGQLYAYTFHLGKKGPKFKAILLPEKPTAETCRLIASLDIGLLWYSPEWTLHSQTPWLKDFVKGADEIKPRAPQRKA